MLVPLAFMGMINVDRDPNNNPTFIPYSSALDIVNGNSKFDVKIQANANYFHDQFPPEVVTALLNKFLPPPAQPQNLQITWAGNHPKLTWDSNLEPDIASYKIWKYAGSPSIVATVINNPNSSTQSWIDYAVTKGDRFASYQFRYKVKAVDNTNKESIYSSEVSIFGNGGIWKIGSESNVNNISTYKLFSNFPNPFNPSTQIEFQIPKDGFVNLTVYNSLGQKITELVNSNLSIGKYNVEFNADNLPSGLYIYKLQAGEFSSVKKMMLTK